MKRLLEKGLKRRQDRVAHLRRGERAAQITSAGAVVEGPSLIRSSVVLPGARIRRGATIDHAITDGVTSASHADVGADHPELQPGQVITAQSAVLHALEVR